MPAIIYFTLLVAVNALHHPKVKLLWLISVFVTLHHLLPFSVYKKHYTIVTLHNYFSMEMLLLHLQLQLITTAGASLECCGLPVALPFHFFPTSSSFITVTAPTRVPVPNALHFVAVYAYYQILFQGVTQMGGV